MALAAKKRRMDIPEGMALVEQSHYMGLLGTEAHVSGLRGQLETEQGLTKKLRQRLEVVEQKLRNKNYAVSDLRRDQEQLKQILQACEARLECSTALIDKQDKTIKALQEEAGRKSLKMKEVQKAVVKIEEQLQCPICLTTQPDMVTLGMCGHLVCSTCMRKKNPSSPNLAVCPYNCVEEARQHWKLIMPMFTETIQAIDTIKSQNY